jgi:hypothetical protein
MEGVADRHQAQIGYILFFREKPKYHSLNFSQFSKNGSFLASLIINHICSTFVLDRFLSRGYLGYINRGQGDFP